AMAQAVPEYPDKLDFTMNGEKELPGVTVTQEMEPYEGEDYLQVRVSGESNADFITFDIPTPEGWDSLLVYSDYTGGGFEIDPLKSKAPAKEGDDYWIPLSFASWYYLQPGNSLTFPVDGEEWGGKVFFVRGEEFYSIEIDFTFEVKKVGGEVEVEAPAFPNHLDFTMNGEKELPGITVKQVLDGTTNVINISGKCNSDKISVTFATPEGWDELMIADFFEYGEISTVKTRGADLIPVENILGQRFKKGNTITYDTDGESNSGYIALIKGDMACSTYINFDITVSKSEGEDPGDEPAFPENFVVTTYNDGLEVTQGVEWGVYTINVSGEVSSETFPIVIDVPEGWDGFLAYDWTKGDVTITENNQGGKSTRADEIAWVPVEELLADGYVKGNRFTFKPTYIPEMGNRQTVELHLYKGDMAMEDWINIDICVTKGEGEDPAVPVFPDEFDITTNNGVKATQTTLSELPEGTLDEMEMELAGMMNCENTVLISGTTPDEKVTVEFNLPKGWAGVQPFKINLPDFGDYEYYKTRANESDWAMLDELKANLGYMMGYFDTTMEGGKKFEFNVGEKSLYLCYLYADLTEGGETMTLADTANAFLMVVNVENGEAPALAFPDKFDLTFNCEGLSVTQEMEEFEGEQQFDIIIEGECSEDKLTVTFAVPEGWDGFIGVSDSDYSYDPEPLNTRSIDDPDMWAPAYIIEQYMRAKRTNELTFNIDGEDHAGYMFLYKDEMAYGIPIYVSVEVMPKLNAVDSIDSAADARYYNLNGAEVSNPDAGIYVKVVNGKASKVVVK
ncbi:MAG: hypothetical protein K2N25_05215, partial [Muribaculaceae bacterium]|nr:hypothetical protein [Muribaculaceae bacterium]